MQTPWGFSWIAKKRRWRNSVGFWATLWGKPCAIFGERKWPAQVRSRSYDVIRLISQCAKHDQTRYWHGTDLRLSESPKQSQAGTCRAIYERGRSTNLSSQHRQQEETASLSVAQGMIAQSRPLLALARWRQVWQWPGVAQNVCVSICYCCASDWSASVEKINGITNRPQKWVLFFCGLWMYLCTCMDGFMLCMDLCIMYVFMYHVCIYVSCMDLCIMYGFRYVSCMDLCIMKPWRHSYLFPGSGSDHCKPLQNKIASKRSCIQSPAR